MVGYSIIQWLKDSIWGYCHPVLQKTDSSLSSLVYISLTHIMYPMSTLLNKIGLKSVLHPKGQVVSHLFFSQLATSFKNILVSWDTNLSAPGAFYRLCDALWIPQHCYKSCLSKRDVWGRWEESVLMQNAWSNIFSRYPMLEVQEQYFWIQADKE